MNRVLKSHNHNLPLTVLSLLWGWTSEIAVWIESPSAKSNRTWLATLLSVPRYILVFRQCRRAYDPYHRTTVSELRHHLGNAYERASIVYCSRAVALTLDIPGGTKTSPGFTSFVSFPCLSQSLIFNPRLAPFRTTLHSHSPSPPLSFYVPWRSHL